MKYKKYNLILNNKSNKKEFFLLKYYKNIKNINILKKNNIKLFTNTNLILKILIKDINIAKKNIKMIFYIWKLGGLVDKVVESLISASIRGVYCRLIIDSSGSIDFFKSINAKLMRNAGIYLTEALKINLIYIFIRRMDIRQHRKIILIDDYISYTGSMNMVDSFFFKKKDGSWKDIMIRMEGALSNYFNIIFSYDWVIETGKYIQPYFIKNKNKKFKKNKYIVRMLVSGLGFSNNLIQKELISYIYSAKKNIMLTTPYLVPSNDLLNAFCKVSKRGVKVNIILPKNNDSFLVDWVSRSFFNKLIKSGVLIHQFQKGILHTKTILIDKKLSILGTLNIDMRSLYINFEIIFIINNNIFGKNIYLLQKKYITKSKLINLNLWIYRPYWQCFFEKVFYFLHSLL